MARLSGSWQTLLGWAGLAFLATLSLVACGQGEGERASTPASAYQVLPVFAPFYERYGGADTFGEPITGLCETGEGHPAQYFERMRLDQVNANRLRLYPLGEWALQGVVEPVPAPVSPTGRQRLFPETELTVQDEFLSFYEDNQGDVILGPPISPQLDEGEMRVQYFRYGRLEWHPTAPRAQRVQVSLLGQAHFAQSGATVVCDVLARPVELNTGVPVDIDASVRSPILYTGEEQVIYVEVSTTGGVGLAELPADVTVVYQGQQSTQSLGETDKQGGIVAPLQLPEFEPGHKVNLTVTVYTEGGAFLGTTSLSFETWW